LLVQAYENWKKKAKKAAAEEKVERKKTGGGSFEPKIDSTAEKLLAMLGNRATPLNNPFDGDAEYNNDAGRLFSYNLLCSCSIFEQVSFICNT
jgi:hypothetical protein